jgi:hypothetical protein
MLLILFCECSCFLFFFFTAKQVWGVECWKKGKEGDNGVFFKNPEDEKEGKMSILRSSFF